MTTILRSASHALLAIAICASTASAQIEKCQRAITKASAQYVQARAKALSKCEEAVVKSGVGTCPDGTAQTSIDKALAKMQSAIAKSCGAPTNYAAASRRANSHLPRSAGRTPAPISKRATTRTRSTIAAASRRASPASTTRPSIRP